MIRLIYGIPGAGKTALMTALCIEQMYGENADRALEGANDEVAMLNAKGFHVTAPKSNHLVYCSKLTIDVTSSEFGHRRSLELDVKRLGMAMKDFTPQYLYPHSTLAFDEVPEDVDSREWKDFSQGQRRYFAKHRKMDFTIYATCQDIDQVEKRFRALAAITEVRNLDIVYDKFGEIMQVVWHLNNWHCFQDWARGVEPTPETYVYNGNIFEAYDTYEGKEEFYVGLEKADFSCEYAKHSDFSPQGIAEYGKRNAIN